MKLLALFLLVFSFASFAQDGSKSGEGTNIYLQRADLMFQKSILKASDASRVEPYHTLALMKIEHDIELINLEIEVGKESQEYELKKDELDRKLKDEHLKLLNSLE